MSVTRWSRPGVQPAEVRLVAALPGALVQPDAVVVGRRPPGVDHRAGLQQVHTVHPPRGQRAVGTADRHLHPVAANGPAVLRTPRPTTRRLPTSPSLRGRRPPAGADRRAAPSRPRARARPAARRRRGTERAVRLLARAQRRPLPRHGDLLLRPGAVESPGSVPDSTTVPSTVTSQETRRWDRSRKSYLLRTRSRSSPTSVASNGWNSRLASHIAGCAVRSGQNRPSQTKFPSCGVSPKSPP